MSRVSSATRKWLLLIGGIIVFIVAFDLLESLVSTDSATGSNDSTTPADAARSPAPPELRRLDDGAIEIRSDFFRRTTIRLGGDERERALFDCLAEGIEETFGNGTAGWTNQRVRSETERITDECMDSVAGLPIPPRLPKPGD